MRHIFLLLLFFAFLLPSASADFNAFGDNAISFERCTSQTYNLTIQNTGEQPANYQISIDGTASDFVRFSATEFSLQPQQIGIIAESFTMPCDQKAESTLNIYFNDGEQEKVLAQEIAVTTPDTLNFTIDQTSAVIKPCETATYKINITNPANFTEIYTIDATGHPNVHVTQKNLVLLPYQQKTVDIAITPDDCTQSGSFPLTVTLQSEKSAQTKEISLEFIITPTDIPVLAEDVTTIRTDLNDSTAELTIRNIGDRITQYTLSIEELQWASITPKTTSLNPGQSTTLALRLNPPAGTSKGKYPLTLIATVQETGIKYTKELTIKVKPQTAFERNPVRFILVLSALIIVILLIITGIILLIRYLLSQNFRNKLQKLKEAVQRWRAARAEARKKNAERKALLLKQKREEEARKQAELKKQKEHEQKEQERKKEREEKEQEREKERAEKLRERIKAQLENEYKKEYHLIARKDVTSARKKSGPRNIIVLLVAVAILALLLLGWKFIIPNISSVVTGILILVLIYITNCVIRKRVIKAQWRLVPEGQTLTLNAWKSGLRLLAITPEQNTKNFKVIAQKCKAPTPPSPFVYQSFTVKTNADADITATFSISKKWLARKGATLDDMRFGRYANQAWKAITFEKSGEDSTSVHFKAEITTGLHAIYLKLKKQPAKSNKPKIIAGIIVLAVLAFLATTIRTSNPQGVIPPQTWKQDTVHTIDLSQYFKDPDNDVLTFSAIGNKHITADFVGSKAILTPESGWKGEEMVKFVARDGKGGTISSNSVSMRVIKTIVPLHLQPIALIVLAVLAILVLVWTVRNLKKTN